MKDELSRRDFIVKTALAVGTAVVAELTGGFGTKEMAGSEPLTLQVSKDKTMPHISVKLWPGRSEETKQRLADAIAKDVVDIIGCDASSVSVTIEEVPPGDWKEKVYEPDIRGKKEYLYKSPGYTM